MHCTPARDTCCRQAAVAGVGSTMLRTHNVAQLTRQHTHQRQCRFYSMYALRAVPALIMVQRAAGVAIANNPLDQVLEFQERADAQKNPHADGCLTATYPEVEKEDGCVMINYPNQGRAFSFPSVLCSRNADGFPANDSADSVLRPGKPRQTRQCACRRLLQSYHTRRCVRRHFRWMRRHRRQRGLARVRVP